MLETGLVSCCSRIGWWSGDVSEWGGERTALVGYDWFGSWGDGSVVFGSGVLESGGSESICDDVYRIK